MKHLYLCILILCPCLLYGLKKEIPQVPSNIEIAGINLKITTDAQQEIQKDINSLHASEKYYLIKVDRANLYFPIIERILKEEGVPDDIKYLSLQESALISDAVSSAQAVGFWQFKDFTGREVGLRIDKEVDERKNIVSATRGAAKYFKRNNFFLKNWIYAVNAYLAGPGGVKAFVDEKNFGSDRLTIDKNTHWYVKRFIAHVIAFKADMGKPHSEGLRLSEFTRGQNKELEEVARLFKIEEETVREYNKWLLRGKIPDDKVYTVIVPVKGKSPVIRDQDDPASGPVVKNVTGKETNETTYPDQLKSDLAGENEPILFEINGLDAFIARPKDNVKLVAEKLNMRESRLQRINDLPSASLQAGNLYYVQQKKNRSSTHFHVVQPGETLWMISQNYGIKLKKLAHKNRISPTDKPKQGLVLWLRKRRPADVAPEYRPVVMKTPPQEVKVLPPKKDELPETQAKIDIPQSAEEKRVEMEVSETVIELKESPATTKEPEKPGGEKAHKVQSGESLWSIAQKYGLTIENLQTWNPSITKVSLQPGQLLKVVAPEDWLSPDTTNEIVPKEKQTPASIHTVEPEETLYSISKKYEMTVEALLAANGLDVNDPIKPGQVLKIIKTNPKPINQEVKPAASHTYKVESGDSLYKIAKKFNTTVENLMQWNKKESVDLAVDEVLIIRDPGSGN